MNIIIIRNVLLSANIFNALLCSLPDSNWFAVSRKAIHSVNSNYGMYSFLLTFLKNLWNECGFKINYINNVDNIWFWPNVFKYFIYCYILVHLLKHFSFIFDTWIEWVFSIFSAHIAVYISLLYDSGMQFHIFFH